MFTGLKVHCWQRTMPPMQTLPAKSPQFQRLKTRVKAILTGIRTFRLIPRFEQYAAVVSFVETWQGRVCIFLAFGLVFLTVSVGNPKLLAVQCRDSLASLLACLWINHASVVAISLGAAACAFSGRYRYWVLTVTTVFFLVFKGFGFSAGLETRVAASEGVGDAIDFDIVRLFGLMAMYLFSAFAIYLAHRFRRGTVGSKPILCVVALFACMVLVASLGPLHGTGLVLLWSFIATLGRNFGFLGYALLDQSSKTPTPLPLHFGTFHAFWISTASTPFGKGVAYLRKFEAQNSHDLAVTQIKGLKLMAWVLFLGIVKAVFLSVIHGYLHIPLYDDAFDRHMAGHPYPWQICWATLLATFFEDVLGMALWGGTMIACARMAGFRLLRNTYRPLASRTIADFWNRYYFYYKELLVDFFFYPTFIRCFRGSPRLRLFFATFMAACVGNMLFHFMRDIDYVATLGLVNAVTGFQTFAFYCIVLAAGIGISQLRGQQAGAGQAWVGAKLMSTVRVVLFFSLLRIFDYAPRDHLLADHLAFFFHLFGIDIS